MNISKLHEAISSVAPIYGVSSSGRIDFKSEATEAQKEAARELLKNWQDVPETVELTKLEFKRRLIAAGKYAQAKDILDALPADKLEDWQLASCVASDNEDILAVLSALEIEPSTIFY